MRSTALATQLNIENAELINERVNTNYKYLDEVVTNLLADYTEDLDNVVSYVRQSISDNREFTEDELCRLITLLPTIIYYVAEGVEKLGLKEDIISAIRSDLYNSAFRRATGTIPDKETAAHLVCQQEQIILTAYNRSYKIIKLKLEAGYELINSLKKMLDNKRSSKGNYA